MIQNILFYVFASMAVGGALGMVTRKNPIASLLFLVLTFFSLAAIYVTLDAHFIAAVQVIVYAGAIMVLFLFVIMLLNLGHDYHADIRGGLWIVLGFIASGTIGGILATRLLGHGPLAENALPVIQEALRTQNAVGTIAFPMFRTYIVPFELTSILLLVAIIGAVLLAKRRV